MSVLELLASSRATRAMAAAARATTQVGLFSDLGSFTISAAIDRISTTGWGQIGVGAAAYVKTIVTGETLFRKQSADGAWWTLNISPVEPEMLGATGAADGAADTAALTAAILNYRRIRQSRRNLYLSASLPPLASGTIYEGDAEFSSQILAAADGITMMTNGSGSVIRNIRLDGMNRAAAGLVMPAGTSLPSTENVRIRQINGDGLRHSGAQNFAHYKPYLELNRTNIRFTDADNANGKFFHSVVRGRNKGDALALATDRWLIANASALGKIRGIDFFGGIFEDGEDGLYGLELNGGAIRFHGVEMGGGGGSAAVGLVTGGTHLFDDCDFTLGGTNTCIVGTGGEYNVVRGGASGRNGRQYWSLFTGNYKWNGRVGIPVIEVNFRDPAGAGAIPTTVAAAARFFVVTGATGSIDAIAGKMSVSMTASAGSGVRVQADTTGASMSAAPTAGRMIRVRGLISALAGTIRLQIRSAAGVATDIATLSNGPFDVYCALPGGENYNFSLTSGEAVAKTFDLQSFLVEII